MRYSRKRVRRANRVCRPRRDHCAPARSRRLAAQRGIYVVTTLGESTDYLAMGDKSGLDAATRTMIRDLYIRNLRLLRSAGVRIALGSDNFRGNTVTEIMSVRTLGVFDDRELLRMWSVVTPKTIFPGRHIACFDAGCEASFLAFRQLLTERPAAWAPASPPTGLN